MKRLLAAGLSALIVLFSPGLPAFQAFAAELAESAPLSVRTTAAPRPLQLGGVPTLSLGVSLSNVDLGITPAASLEAAQAQQAARRSETAATAAASAASAQTASAASSVEASAREQIQASSNRAEVKSADSQARSAPRTSRARVALGRALDGWRALTGAERRVETVPDSASSSYNLSKVPLGARLSRAKVPLLTAAATLAVPAAAFAADPSLAHHAVASSIGYWDAHGALEGFGLLALLTYFPRLTLAAMAALTNSFEVTLLGTVGWVFLPRFVVAALATTVYWNTNPWLVAAAWAIAILDLRSSKKDKKKEDGGDARVRAIKDYGYRARPRALRSQRLPESFKLPKRVALAVLLGGLMFVPAWLHAHGVDPLPSAPQSHLTAAALWTAGLTAVKIALAYLTLWLNPAVMDGDDDLHITSFSRAFFLSAFAGTVEELIFRGVLYGGLFWALTALAGLVPGAAFAVAAFTSAYIFARIHGYGSIWSRVMSGIFFAGLYFLTGNLLWPILVHFLFDFVLMSMAVVASKSKR